MSSTNPLDMSALEQARLIGEGAISSEELVTQTLQRIRRLDPTYRAFVSVFEGAIAAARRKDRAVGRSRGALPPFHGVPIGPWPISLCRLTTGQWRRCGGPDL